MPEVFEHPVNEGKIGRQEENELSINLPNQVKGLLGAATARMDNEWIGDGLVT